MRSMADQGRAYLGGRIGRAMLILALLALEVAVGSGHAFLGRLQVSPQMVTLGAGLLVVAVLTFRRIEYGLLLLPAIATLVPLSIGTGRGSRVVASLVFAAFLVAVWLSMVLVSRQPVLKRSPLWLPMLGFVLSIILSTIGGNALLPPLVSAPQAWTITQMGGLSVFVLSAGIFLVVMNSLDRVVWIERLTWVLIAMGALTMAGYLIRSGNDLPGASTQGLFSMWIIALAVGQALYNDRIPRWGRAALLALAALWMYRRFFLELAWFSGWLPALVALLTIALLRSRRWFFLALVGTLILGAAQYEVILDTQVSGGDSASNALRLDLWAQNMEVTRDHLLIGTGVAGYALYYMTYFVDTGLSTHSNYIDIFSQTGIIGSFFFVWFLVALFRVGLAVRRRYPTGFVAGFASSAIGGFMGLLVAMSLGDWFIPFVYNQTIEGFRYTVHSWILLGALASLQYAEER